MNSKIQRKRLKNREKECKIENNLTKNILLRRKLTSIRDTQKKRREKIREKKKC